MPGLSSVDITTPGVESARNDWKPSTSVILISLVYALALIVSINGSSLWADEAFSAWLASHETLRSFWASLIHGDSSDLQMGLYYLYLFGWSHIFGASEYALRAANIPFIALFAYSMVWASAKIFRSRIAWIVPGLLPFVWHYAAEARPYMAMLGFGSAALAALLAFIQARGPDARRFPSLCLLAVFIGSCFHMLFLLAAPPLMLIGLQAWRGTRDNPKWEYWKSAARVFALPFLALGAFFAFTFARGTAYDYPHPGLRQMASVAYELSGLAGFGPNRKFSLDFRSYLIPLAIGGTLLLLGAVFAFRGGRAIRKTSPLLAGLAGAVCLAFLEAVVLSTAMGKQIDVRHLAAVVPLLLFLLLATLSQNSKAAKVSMLLLASGWLIADLRLAVLPQYQKEDYRDAVPAALSIQRQMGAEIAIVADPVGAAYYGMNVEGAAPCFPIRQDCRGAFNMVPWTTRGGVAVEAERWPASSIEEWLSTLRKRGVPVVVFAQTDRAHRESAWWAVLASGAARSVTHMHGFDIDVLN
ncbi:MAG TPA: hypothetical protein VHZ74_18930 [Bryobacteraceae bacterium]|nr:hypothetical protein [Bryobacteraceae bacterium]